MLKPIASLLLRHNIAAGELVQCVKEAYVEAGECQLLESGEKATNAKLAVLTGLDRNEVSRIKRGVDRQGKPLDENAPLTHLNRAARVVTNWPKKNGKALNIPLSGDNSFTELVNKHSGGIPIPSLLEELERNNMVHRHSDETIELIKKTFIPSDGMGKLDIASEQLARLLSTVDHNIHSDNTNEPFIQLELLFEGLNDDFVEVFRHASRTEITKTLNKLAQELEQQRTNNDKYEQLDVHRKTGLGVYFFDVKNMTERDNNGE